MDIYHWGGKRGGKNWRLKIYPPNVAFFGKNLAVFGFWDLATLNRTTCFKLPVWFDELFLLNILQILLSSYILHIGIFSISNIKTSYWPLRKHKCCTSSNSLFGCSKRT